MVEVLGQENGRGKFNIVSAFEAYGARLSNSISDDIMKESKIHPGPGACGMYTANTMSSAIEAFRMSLPFSSSNPAESQDKESKL